MKLSKILTYVAIAFVIWWVIQQPTSAAHLVHNIGTCSAALRTVCRISWRRSDAGAGISNGY